MPTTVTAKLAYPHTLVTLYKKYFLTTSELELLIRENCTDEVDQLLSKAGLGILIRDNQSRDVCQYADPEMNSAFLNEFIKQSVRIVRAFSGVEHEFLVYWLRQKEVSNIKTILRAKAVHRPSEMIRPQLFDLGAFSTLPLDELLHCEDVSEVLRVLEKTSYASLARYTLAQYEQHNDIFSLETSVDQQFFIGLIRRQNMLGTEDKDLLHPLSGRIIDQMNLIRLLRYRINYNLSPSHTYFLLSSGGFRLKQQELLRLVKIKRLEEALSELPASLSRYLNEKLNAPAQSIQALNSVMEQDVIDNAKHFLTTETFSLTSVFAYFIIRKQQLSLIHAILKGKAMHMDEPTIRFAVGMN